MPVIKRRYSSMISFISEFWIVRRGLAYGIICAASGVSGVVMPFAIEFNIAKEGYHSTLGFITFEILVLTGSLITMLKGRLPHSEASAVARTNWQAL
ncbi:unnamed protein product [Diplocarpon coronariae]|nr:major facilitator superfamily transporter [Diplocarpon mali]